MQPTFGKLACLVLLLFTHVAQAAPLALKTASQLLSAPRYYRDLNNGQMHGLCIEIMAALEQQDPELQFYGQQRTLPWGKLQQQLQSGEVDVFFGMYRTREREETYRFADTPLYTMTHRVAVRSNDHVAINNLADIAALGDEGKVLVLAESGAAGYLRAHAPEIQLIEVPTLPAALEALNRGLGRFVYYHELGLINQIRQTGLQNDIIIIPKEFNRYQHYAAFSPGSDPRMIKRIDQALKQLKDKGTLAALYTKYLMNL